MKRMTNASHLAVPELNRDLHVSEAAHDTAWIIGLAAVLGGLMVLLRIVVGPAPIPERLLDALVFAGVLLLVEATLQSRGGRDGIDLILAAVTATALAVLASPAVALAFCLVSLVLWVGHARAPAGHQQSASR